MRSLVVASLFMAMLPCVAFAKSDDDKFDPAKFDTNHNRAIDVGSETDVILMHKKNPVLAACDGGSGNFNGSLDTPGEMACANEFFRKSIRRARVEARDLDPDKNGKLTYEEAKAGFGKPEKEGDIELPFLVRDAYTPISVNSRKKLEPQSKVGARIAYSHDYDSRDTTYTMTGALLFPFDLGLAPDKKITERKPTVDELLVIPAVEFNRVTHTQNPNKDVNYLGFHLGAEALLQYYPIFPTQFARFGGYYKTDFDGDTQIPGVYAEWQPYFLTYGISAPKAIPGTPVNFMITPSLRTEYEHVSRVGNSKGVAQGDDYARGGGILEGQLWFDDGPLERFSLHAKYWKLYDFRRDQSSERHYFQADLLYSLDPKKHFALDFRFRRGDEPALGIPVHDITAGLSFKY